MAESSTRVSLTIFSARLEPRDVTQSPGEVHRAATNAATESVVPATTTHPSGNLDRASADATVPARVPGGSTRAGRVDAYGAPDNHDGYDPSPAGSNPSLSALL